MVQFLERNDRPSTAQRFLNAFSNAGQALPESLATYQKMKGAEQQAAAKRADLTSKNLGNLSTFVSRELKNRGLKAQAEDPYYLKNFLQKADELVRQGIEPYEAFNYVFSSLNGEQGADEGSQDILTQLMGKKDNSFEENLFSSMKSPIPKQFGSIKEDPLLNLLTKHPGKSAGLAGLGLASPIEEVVRAGPSKAAMELAGQLGFTYPEFNQDPERLLTAQARKKLLEGVEEREQKAAPQVEFLGSLLPIGRIAKLLGLGKSKAISPSQILLPEKAEQKLLGFAARQAEEAAPSIEKSLAGRVSKKELSPTEMRIARSKPEQRIYPRLKNVETREAQLKAFPKYEAEIAEDAAARAARAEKRIPKTEKGIISQQARIAEAEKHLPSAKESYSKSAARVRALEDEVAKYKGPEKERLQAILEHAAKDLKDAEFNLVNRLENTKGINYRSTAQEMRDAARKKMLDLSDKISAGEEYKLAKMDYSPDLIAEANKIAKKKPLPTTKYEDFYTKVHDEYAHEYRNQLSKIEKDLKSTPKNMVHAEKIRNLQKEKDILQKMIKSAEAENTIHRHKFALREISERKKAQERIAQFQKQQAHPKVKKAAEQKMWREHVKNIKTAEGRTKAANDLVEDVAKKDPKIGESLRKDKNDLKDVFEKINKKSENIKETLKSIPKEKDAKKFSHKILDDFKEVWDSLVHKNKPVWKTKIVQESLKGLFLGIIDDVLKELDSPIGTSIIAYAAWGRGRGPYQIAAHKLAKAGIKKYKVNEAAKAYKRHDNAALNNYSPSIKKLAREKAFNK